MVTTKYKRQPVSGRRKVALKTLPDQAMSINEIVRRFVKNIPITGVNERQEVYVDQSEHDLEKLSRMDFGEKAEYAQAMAEENTRKVEAFKQAQQESRKRKQQAQQKADDKRVSEAQKRTGIGPLDNTMPDDTSLKTK